MMGRVAAADSLNPLALGPRGVAAHGRPLPVGKTRELYLFPVFFNTILYFYYTLYTKYIYSICYILYIYGVRIEFKRSV